MTKRLSSFLFILFFLGCVQSSLAQTGLFKWVHGGGSADGSINSVAYSSNGDFVYVGGNLIGNPGVSYPVVVSGANGQDGFVAKYTSSGSLIWIFTVGGNAMDNVSSITVDANDNVIVGGTFESTDANFIGTSGGSAILSSVGQSDIFIAKYNTNGVLTWLRQGTSAQDDFLSDMTVDAANNIYVAGSSDGAFNYYGNPISSNGGREAFGIKILSDGTFSWIKSVGSTGTDEMTGVAVFNNKAYFGGHFDGLQLFNLSGPVIAILNLSVGTSDMFINKYDAITGNYENNKIIGGSGVDKLKSLSNNGVNLVLSGTTQGSLTIDADSYNNSNQEILTAMADVNFNLVWSHSTSHSAVGVADVGGIECLPNGQTVVTGRYTGTLNTGLAPDLTSTNQDGLVIIYNGAGNVVSRTRFFGPQNEQGRAVSVKNAQTFFIGGQYEENAFFPNINVSGNNTSKHPFVAAFGCVEDTAMLTLSGSDSICSGQTTNLLVTFNGTGPFSGTISNGSTLQTFTNVAGPTFTLSVTPAVGTSVFTITSFTSAGCGQIMVGSVSITVHPPVTNNIIFDDTTICYNDIPSFTGTIPSGGDGSAPVYLWQYFTGFSWFSGNGIPNNAQNYTSISLTANRLFRRIVTINGCPSNISNVVEVNVLANTPALGNNTISAAQSICNGTTPSGLTGGVGTGGTGVYSYQWQSSPDQLVWTNQVTTQNYSPPSLTDSSYFRRILFSGLCDSDTSNTILIAVFPIITNNIISSDITHCGPSASTLTGTVPVGADGGAPTYQWQYSTNSGTSWFPGVGTNFLQNYVSSMDNATTWYRRRVSIGGCPSVFSNIVVATIIPPVANNSISLGTTTFCGPSNPGIINGTTPTGGNGTYGFFWQSSTDNVTWTDVGSTPNFSPGVLSSSTYFRRRVNSGGCNQHNVSNVILINIQNAIGNNTITGDENLCQGASPSSIIGSFPSGGNGTYNYVWRSSTDNVVYNDVAPATNSINYSPSTQPTTYYYKRVVLSGICPSDTSSSVQKFVYPSITNNTIASDFTICANTTAPVLSGTLPSGGDGSTILYQWQSSTDNVNFLPAVGSINGINYAPGVLTNTTYFRRAVNRGPCGPNYSDTVIITVQPALSNNIISNNQDLCGSSTAALLTGVPMAGGNGTYWYSWYESTDSLTWSFVANTENYLPGTVSTTSFYYRNVVSGFCTIPDTSNVLKITVQPALGNNVISLTNTLLCGPSDPGQISGSAPTGGNGSTYDYIWQSSLDNATWTPVGTSVDYSPGTISDTTYLRRLVTSGACTSPSISNIIQVNVLPTIGNNTISSNQTFCVGTASDTIIGFAATAYNPITYTWQQSIDNISWIGASGVAIGNNFLPNNLTQTTHFRRLASSSFCPNDTSNIVTYTVEQSIANNLLSLSQSTICSSNISTFINGSVPTNGNGVYLYSWQKSYDSIAWTSGASTSEDYSVGTIVQSTYYRRIVNSGFCGADTSAPVLLTVSPFITTNDLSSSSQTICYDSVPLPLTGAVQTPGTFEFLWQTSLDNTTFISASGINNQASYSPGNLTQTTYYRRIIKSGVCPNDTSIFVSVAVVDTLANNVISNDTSVCSGSTGILLTGTLPTGGNGSYTYLWQSSTNGTTYLPAPGANSNSSYSIPLATQSIKYRRITFCVFCPSDSIVSNTVLVTVYDSIMNNNISANQNICFNTIPALLNGTIATGGGGTLNYLWQQSLDTITWTTVGTSEDYLPGALGDTTFFRRAVISSICLDTNYSNIVVIHVQDTITNNSIASNQIICNGNPAVLIDGLPVQGGDGFPNYNWQMASDSAGPWTIVGFSEDYTPIGLTDTTYFRRNVVSGACSTVNFSNIVTIFYQDDISNNIITGSDTLCDGYIPNTLLGSVAAGGSNSPNYSWQMSLDLLTWTNVGTSQNHTPGAITDTTYYRRLVTAGSCVSPNLSNVLTLIYIAPLTGTLIMDNDTICAGQVPNVIFASNTQGGGGALTNNYTWQQSTGGSWGPAVGTDLGSIFIPPSLFDTTDYRLIVSSLNCLSDTSNKVTVIVEEAIANNSISGPAFVCSNSINDTLYGTLPINGNLIYAYQWQSSADNSFWSNIASATNQNHTISNLTVGTFFRRIVTSGQCGSDTSNSIFVDLNFFINTNAISSSQTICNGTSPQLITGLNPSGSGFNYQWLSSTDNVIYSSAISPANAAVYQPGNLSQTTYYKRVITSGVCGSDTSNVVTITVYDLLTDNSIFNDTTICYNSGPITLTGSTPQGGNGNYTYLWESMTVGGNFSTASGNSSAPNYVTGSMTQTTHYRRIVTSNACPSEVLISDTVLILVHPLVTATFGVTNDTVCLGEDVNISLTFTGQAPFTFGFTYGGQPLTVVNNMTSTYNFIFNPTVSGYVEIDSLQDANGCEVFPTDTMFYRVVNYPIIFLGNDTTVCDEMTFTPSYGTGNLNFYSPSLGTISNSFPQTYISSIFGSHDFVLTETIENCTSYDTMSVNFIEPINGISAGDDQIIMVQDSIILDATDLLSNETGVWTLISGAGTFGDTLDPKSVFSDLISGITILEWTVSNGVCPSKSDQVIFDIRNLILPTGFSPNNDGTNDILEFAGREDIETIKIQIFDRWGGLVFDDNDYQNDWGGATKSGDNLPEDTYFMIVDLGDKGIFKSYLIIRR
jgi:large repetitive protein